MNVSTFLKHWNIKENPFLAEEARQDQVFARLAGPSGELRPGGRGLESQHPDFEKILGDPSRPATAIVFGEKGAGKTAIRLQIEDAIRSHNGKHPDAKTLVVPYDDLNPILDRFVRSQATSDPTKALESLRLVDHIDGILSVAVPKLVDSVLKNEAGSIDLGERPETVLRRLKPADKKRWSGLQLLYDRPDQLPERGKSLRRALRLFAPNWGRPLRWIGGALWALLIGLIVLYRLADEADRSWLHVLAMVAVGGMATVLSGRLLVDWWKNWKRARRLSDQLRVVDRTVHGWRNALGRMPWGLLQGVSLPLDELDDARYERLDDLCRILAPFGYTSIVVLIDRVDEPSLISGDAARMRSVIWPLFNNKFLQHDRIALKMMLPIELRHELHRQSKEFFQEARMDKQNLIDRLDWSGTTLYDLCSTRLRACAEPGTELSLIDLFDDTVNRQDVVDALDQMRQPRDAFKLMYQLVQQHCATATDEEENWQIPKLVLDQVRREQVERLEALHRGFGPA
ncbi:MAG: hypothetical protein AAF488_07805 [Planctomycetota bacterium]